MIESATVDQAAITRIRRALRRPGDALPNASIGTVPIRWNNVDLPDVVAPVPAHTVIDEIARTGYEGTQEGTGFPTGDQLRHALTARDLRLAEVYVSLPCTPDGPTPDAPEIGRRRLGVLKDGRGDVLVLALELSPERSRRAGRAAESATPRLTMNGSRRLAALVDTLTDEATAHGAQVTWHQHIGTFIETPDEFERLLDSVTTPDLGICLDVGHWIVGGGDPIDAIRRYGRRIRDVHLKDVDAVVLADLRAGRVADFPGAIRARLFTELGAGVLDLDEVVKALVALDYAGWLMVEQDSGWGPPSESAAIGRRVLATTLRRVGAMPIEGGR